MKNLLITTILMLAFHIGFAQEEPPTPPTPPNSSSNYSSSMKSSGKNGSTSVSVSQTDDDYKFRARFPKNRYAKLKTLIENTLGGKNMDIGKGYSKWSNDEKVYYVKLTEKNLRMTVDLNVASPDLAAKISALGKDAKLIISGSTVKVERERMQRKADRMRVEADRMQREAERLERQALREAERTKRMAQREKERMQREQEQIKRAAKRVEREAKRVEREAKRLEEQARHKGGVSSYIKRLLDDPKTKYTATSGANLNWIWPEVQENLLASLLEDNLIKSTAEVTFTTEKDRMYSNGAELTATQYEKYNSMLRNAGIQSNADFSFYKQADHIVVIGLNARIKKVFNDLHKKGHIASTDEAIKLLIDGNSITKNGTVLGKEKVAAYNAILRDNGIIPAPGKYIEMKKAGSYRLGYSLGSKGIVGTWIEEKR
ncbi:hypothetical protein KORDIASMS9_01499 [Kordia sp. SMS9]|uniref:hypothetical protein n=1 Tax=Kordia sp. SMS9 TaxID=2282170 RepID=UPI000E0DFECB|nr:hypothetical protein [Kordia sp. SMS9]AXG69279.1 hypothetical protein KORDIASMS9_01499 [Kordia sp. SMS9]